MELNQDPQAPFHQPCGMLQNHSSSLECPVPDWCMAQGVGRGEGSSWAVLALRVCRALLTTPRCCWRANHCFGADVTLRKQLQNCCPDPTTSQPLLLDGAGWAAARGSGMLPARGLGCVRVCRHLLGTAGPRSCHGCSSFLAVPLFRLGCLCLLPPHLSIHMDSPFHGSGCVCFWCI